jgi:drug/metabolite transporter (DMT)-like permease
MCLRERLSPRMGVAIALSIAAVLLLQAAKHAAPVQQTYALGVALLIAAVLCEASYVVLAKKLSPYLSPKRGSALLNAWGWVLMLPWAAWQWWDTGFSPAQLTLSNGLLLVYYALAASVLSTWLWFTGLRHVAANQAGVYTVALPITAALLGVVVFNETFTAWHALALALAVASVVCASWKPNTP